MFETIFINNLFVFDSKETLSDSDYDDIEKVPAYKNK